MAAPSAKKKEELDVVEYFGEKELRWAQIAIRQGIQQSLKNKVKRILAVLPTGGGKTITIAYTLDHPDIRKALKIRSKRPLRVLVIAHVHRLLTQAERTFAECNNVDLQVTTPFVDINHESIEWADVIVIDEAHHEAMMSIQYQLDELGEKPIIGLTATKDRADGMVIKFEDIIEPCTREQAVAEGWLAETSIWSFVDTSTRNQKAAYVKSIVDNYHQVMGGTMIFMATKREVAEVQRHIEENHPDYVAVALLNQSPRELDAILDAFSRGEVHFIINCDRLGEGVDVVGCTSIVNGQQVASYPRLNQRVGRAARPDSECQVFELVNPLSGKNLDTTVVVGTPKTHLLCSPNGRGGFSEMEFDYTGHHTGMVSGIKPQFEQFS